MKRIFSYKVLIIMAAVFSIAIVLFNMYDLSNNRVLNLSYTAENIKSMDVKKVNINTATKEELCTVPYIGESTAIKIIEYRDQNGDFEKLEDIKNVKGIGDKIFLKIVSMITI